MSEYFRGKNYLFKEADERVRGRKDFAMLADALVARGIDPSWTLFLDGGFVPGGTWDDFLVILPHGKWVWVTWQQGKITDWIEDQHDEYSDDFRAELEKYRLRRQIGQGKSYTKSN